MEKENEVDNNSYLKTLAMLFAGFVSLLIFIALTYFAAETTWGRMNFYAPWISVPAWLVILSISYYITGLFGYFPIPQSCFISCLPRPLLLWRLNTWRKIFRNCLSNRRSYSRLHESPQIRSSPEDTHQESLRDSQSLFHRRISEPSPIILPPNSASRNSNHQRATRPALNSTIEDISKSSVKELFSSADSPVGCVVPMPPMGRKSTQPKYLPSSLEDRAENTKAACEPSHQIQKREIPSRTDDGDIPLRNHPRFPWGYLKTRGGIPYTAIRMHHQHLKVEKHLIERQHRLQREIDRSDFRRDEVQGAVGGLEFNEPNRLLPGRPQLQRRSGAQSQAQHNTRSNKVNGSGQSGKVQGIAGCCDHSQNLQFKDDRTKNVLGKDRDSQNFVAEQKVSSGLEVKTSTEQVAVSESGQAVSSRLQTRNYEKV